MAISFHRFHTWSMHIRVVKAPFFKANLKAVSKRLIKAVKRLLYVVNMMNDCFKIHLVVTKSSSRQNKYTMI